MITVIDDYLEYMSKHIKKSEMIEALLELEDDIENNHKLTYEIILKKINDYCRINHYCPKCACKLQYKRIKEARPYQESISYEVITKEYCPQCNRKTEDLF